MNIQSINLQVILGLNCNFICGHCINDSKPKNNKLDLTEAEILTISEIVNRDNRINAISFNGGEPLIYHEEIIKFKNNVKRNISWNITTNGSLTLLNKKNITFLEKFNVILSYDKFHNKFLSLEKFKEVVELLYNNTESLKINFVYEDPTELELIYDTVGSKCIEIIPTSLIKGGRASKYKDNLSFESNFNCPNIKKDEIKITYIAQNGFTPCCGPLLFDKYVNEESFFTKNTNELNNDYVVTLFESDFVKKLIDKSNFNKQKTPCEICLDLDELLTEENINKNINYINNHLVLSEQPLNDKIKKKFKNKFHIQYLFKLSESSKENEKIKKNKTEKNVTSDLEFKILENPDENIFKNFILENYYKNFSNEYSRLEIQGFVDAIGDYFKGTTLTSFGYKNGEIVSVITAYYFQNYEPLKSSVWHIGYWGIDKKKLTPSEIQEIKDNWIKYRNILLEKRNSDIIAYIDDFNIASIKYALKNSFNQIGIRLKKRI
jgi:MoaA/NifB/PqqE/SkfB family radical SAM enzyme